MLPATGAITALITKAIGKEPYIVGKPNPMMFRSALNRIGAHSENTGMIGDRMDTDIVAGIEAGLHTVLVLTGISDAAEIERYPFRPDEVLDSVADLLADEPIETDLPSRRATIALMGALDDGEQVVAPDAATWRAWLEENHAPRRAPGSCGLAPGRTSRSSATRTRSCRRCASAGSTGRCAASTSDRRAVVRAASPVERVGGDEQGAA